MAASKGGSKVFIQVPAQLDHSALFYPPIYSCSGQSDHVTIVLMNKSILTLVHCINTTGLILRACVESKMDPFNSYRTGKLRYTVPTQCFELDDGIIDSKV